MKQINLFGSMFAPNDEEKNYTTKIEVPTYEPNKSNTHILELYDKSKTDRLMREIENSDLSREEKTFLMNGAQRHIVFNYEKIADYYAHSSKEMQHLMERSALVIIDFEKAVQYGYVKLCDEIRTQYLEEYGE
jgi:hypothetical protein